MADERAVTFDCGGESLLGILHEPPAVAARLGVLIVVGGPQYRVGSHRQFVLMARTLASAGIPAFRFDYRGMGDSAAEPRTFDMVDDDIRAAMDAFMALCPQLAGIVIFGLCDAASAGMIYGPKDERVAGLILANPWVRSSSGEARAFVRHYYGQRLLQATFWRKLLGGRFALRASVNDFVRKLSLSRRLPAPRTSFVDRMLWGLQQFRGPVLFLISERDLTADEFNDLCSTNEAWRAAVAGERCSRVLLVQADHTFSARALLEEATDACVRWVRDRTAAFDRLG